MADYVEIGYDPGIFGFVKAHRHTEGPSLVMSAWEDEDREWAAVFWVKRLHHEASPIAPSVFQLQNSRSMKAVNRAYDIFMSHGPPINAYMEPEPDFQRQRVYNWEEDNIFPGHAPLTWKQCKNFFSRVWKGVGIGQEPSLVINRRFKRPVSFGGRVVFPDCDRDLFWTKPVLLHEIAHELRFADKHGPEFVTQYVTLCVEYLRMSSEDLLVSAERYGIVHCG